MLQFRRVLALFLIPVLLSALCGCRGERQNGGFSQGDTTPTHIYREVQEKLLVDADVKGPPQGVIPKVYSGTAMTFSDEQIQAFLEWQGDAIEEVMRDSDTDGFHIYRAQCRNGGELSHQWVAKGPKLRTLVYRDTPNCQRYDGYPLYHSLMEFEQDTSVPRLEQVMRMFFEPVEMPFATAQEAEARVREGLGLLGLENLALNRTVYISHERMLQVNEILQGDEWAGDSYSPVDDWTEEHDCYLFEFAQTIDGVPYSLRDWGSAYTAYYTPTIMVWYTAKGVVQLLIFYPWTVGEALETPTAILSAEEALQIALDQYDIILTRGHTVEHVELVYTYEQDGDKWRLFPAWEVTIRLTEREDDSFDHPYETIKLDAITGRQY